MNGNYNDILDVILTVINNDEEVSNSIIITGSIIPYVILNEESKQIHDDFLFLVKDKKMNVIRKKMEKLYEEYEFEYISDSKKICKKDYGFEIQYEGTNIGFYPYSLINGIFKIKTYRQISKSKILLKVIGFNNISKNTLIKSMKFSDNKLRILSPEFMLTYLESKENNLNENNNTIMLKKVSDESIIKALKKSNIKCKVNKQLINIYYKKIMTIIIIVLLLLIIVGILIIKK